METRGLPLRPSSSSSSTPSQTTLTNDAVYRSLKVAAPPSVTYGVNTPTKVNAAADYVSDSKQFSNTSANGRIARLPVPLSSYPLPVWHTWISSNKGSFDAGKAVMDFLNKSGITNVKYESEGRFACSKGEGLDCCCFDVYVWDVSQEAEAEDDFFLEVNRTSGCPFAFHHIMGLILNEASSKKLNNCQGFASRKGMSCLNKAFTPPPLPEEFGDCGGGIHMECVARALEAACSEDYNERLQGCCLLSKILKRDPIALEMFKKLPKENLGNLGSLIQDTNGTIANSAKEIVQLLRATS